MTRNEARRATFLLAHAAGAQTTTRPLYPGAEAMTIDVEPLAGARTARDLEWGARTVARDYIRQAREAGHSWDQIGRALGVQYILEGSVRRDSGRVRVAAQLIHHVH